MAKAKKAQMSLEMIIGLLILLVVAVVVIRIFITSFKQDPQKTFESTIKEMNFKSDCDNICSDYKNSGTRAALAKFCYTKMIGDPDLNKNGLIDKYQSMTKVLEICEDSVYCFHVTKCETESGVIDWSDCREATCEAYREVYPDNMNKVDKKVTELFNLGSCKGIKNDEDWIKLYFNQGDNQPCSNPPGSFEIALENCKYDPDGADNDITTTADNWNLKCDITADSLKGECGANNGRMWLIIQKDTSARTDLRTALPCLGSVGGTISVNDVTNKLEAKLEILDGNEPVPGANGKYSFVYTCMSKCDTGAFPIGGEEIFADPV